MRTFWMAVGGAAVGAGLGLLFSPAGKGTRKLISDKTAKCTSDTQDLVMSKARHLRNKARGYGHKAQQLIEHGREVIEKVKTASHAASHDTAAVA
ncbi:MAG: hypothetical protein K0Q72_1083 [Armatimonadetes bacterium]|nr:hypothetical protein [Armatimonadota bacterium]